MIRTPPTKKASSYHTCSSYGVSVKDKRGGEGGEGESSSFMGGAKQAHCNAHLYKYTCQLHDSNLQSHTEVRGMGLLCCLAYLGTPPTTW